MDVVEIQEDDPKSTDEPTNDESKIGIAKEGFTIHQSVFYSHNYFSKVGPDENGKDPEMALCLMCKKKNYLKITNGNTKGLLVHIKSTHPEHAVKFLEQKEAVDKLKQNVLSKKKQMFSSQPKLILGDDKKIKVGGLVSDVNIQNRWDKAVVMFCAQTFTSFNAMEKCDILINAIWPEGTKKKVEVKAKSTISRHASKIAQEVSGDVFSIILSLIEHNNSAGLSMDLWRNKQLNSFISLSIQLLTEDFKIIKLQPFVEWFGNRRHTGENIHMDLKHFAQKLGLINSMMLYLLQDNASNNKKAMKLGSEFVPVWCAIHTLQSAITDSFKSKVGNIEIKDLLEKCQKLAKYCRSSEFSNNELQEACKTTNITYIRPVLANATRWNSTEANLSSLLRLQPALSYLSYSDMSDTWSEKVPSNVEFKVLGALQKVLEVFKITTKQWESDTSPTIHLVVKELWNISDVLSKYSNGPEESVKLISSTLKRLIETRFPSCGTNNNIYAIAHFLDPEFKGLILQQFPGA